MPAYDLLRPYQRGPAQELAQVIARNGNALDASDTGLGKTYVACAVAATLGLRPAIVCPASVMTTWREVCDYFAIEPLFIHSWNKIRGGSTPWYYAADSHGTPLRLADARRQQIRPRWHGLTAAGPSTNAILIMDEIDRTRGVGTQNSELLIAAVRDGVRVLGLSATAFEHPGHMRAIGYWLGLHGLTNFYQWALENGCVPGNYGGLDFPRGGDDFLTIIRNHIFPRCGIRLRRAPLVAAGLLPITDIIPTAVDVSGADARRVNDAYATMQTELDALMDSRVADATRARRRGAALDAMTLMLRARQESELVKVPILIEMAEEMFAEGRSIAIFVNFNATIDALRERMDDVAVIRGGQSERERWANIEAFQRNEVGVIICNIAAGGVGVSLHDVYNTHPRAALICPNYSARDLIQVFGRVDRQGGTDSVQKILFLRGTIEERAYFKCKQKIRNMTLLNDGVLSDDDLLEGINL